MTRVLHYDVQRLGRSLWLPPKPHLAAAAAQTCLTASSGSVTHMPMVSAPRQPLSHLQRSDTALGCHESAQGLHMPSLCHDTLANRSAAFEPMQLLLQA